MKSGAPWYAGAPDVEPLLLRRELLLFLLGAVLNVSPAGLALQDLQNLIVEAVAGARFGVLGLLLGDEGISLLVQVAGLFIERGPLLVDLVQVITLLLQGQLLQFGRQVLLLDVLEFDAAVLDAFQKAITGPLAGVGIEGGAVGLD